MGVIFGGQTNTGFLRTFLGGKFFARNVWVNFTRQLTRVVVIPMHDYKSLWVAVTI